MAYSDKLNTKDLLKHLKYLMPVYLENLDRPVEDESEGQLSVFTNNELLIRYFFSTSYANAHLDYDFFCMAIQDIIGHGKIHDAAKAVQELSDFVERSAEHDHWVAVIPIRFDSILGMFNHEAISETHSFGRFTLLKPAADWNDFKGVMEEAFGVASLQEDGYRHQVTQGLRESQEVPALAFEVRGTIDARDWSAKRKLAHFCNLAEVFCVIGDAIGIPNESRKIPKAFFANMRTGKIGRVTLDRDAPVNIDMSESFLDFLHQNDFASFADMVFTTEDDVFARLRSALYFFSKGFNGEDRVLSFVCYVIAIEALFTGIANGRITEHLCVCVSRLCYPETEWAQVELDVKEIYKQRSAIMHHGKFDLSNGKVERAREIAASAIFHTFRLHKQLCEEGANGLAKGGMAQRFATHVKHWFPKKQASSASGPEVVTY